MVIEGTALQLELSRWKKHGKVLADGAIPRPRMSGVHEHGMKARGSTTRHAVPRQKVFPRPASKMHGELPVRRAQRSNELEQEQERERLLVARPIAPRKGLGCAWDQRARESNRNRL